MVEDSKTSVGETRKVILIEDEVDIAETIRYFFEKKGLEIDHFISSEEYLTKKDDLRPAVFLIDWNLPGEPGVQLIKKIRENDKTSPIIMVSAFSTNDQMLEGLEAGADDYVTKPFNYDLLYQKVYNAHRKYQVILENAFGEGVRLIEEAHAFMKDGKTYSLTPREYTIFKHLHEEPGRPIDRESLVGLFGDDEKVTNRNIDVHIFSLRKKIKESGISIQTIWGKGYQLVE